MTIAQVIALGDLRTEPTDEPKISNGHDRRRDSQVLGGRLVRVLKSEGEWSFIEVPDQLTGHFLSNIHPYRGWVKSNILKIGAPDTKLGVERQVVSRVWSEASRQQIVDYARTFLGKNYLWGGMSHEGVDCSGLTYLSFDAVGIELPRDAKDQEKVCVPTASLLPADLLFSSYVGKPINHVMVWTGDSIIEATDTDNVREITFEKKFGIPLSSITGDSFSTDTITVYFRRFFR